MTVQLAVYNALYATQMSRRGHRSKTLIKAAHFTAHSVCHMCMTYETKSPRAPSTDRNDDRALYGAQKFIRDTDSAIPDSKEIPEESSIQSPAMSLHRSTDGRNPLHLSRALIFLWTILSFLMQCVHEFAKALLGLVKLVGAASLICSVVPLSGTRACDWALQCANTQSVAPVLKSIWNTIPFALISSFPNSSAGLDSENSINLNITQIPVSVLHEGTSDTSHPRFDIKLILRLMGKIIPSPDMVLKCDLQPGSWWPMRGSSGHITLQFQAPAMVHSVTLSHGVHLSKTAPNLVLLWAVIRDNHNSTAGPHGSNTSQLVEQDASLADRLRPILDDGYILYPAGEIQYDTRSTSRTQPFSLYPSFLNLDLPTSALVIQIINNWGNQHFTCIYHIGVYTRQLMK
ncbi:hypothetical protein K474DRAFT_1679382 [Panus rudis PR-1116 ss-1]|nr:hypothetical protein K474DRAFT_1679382 [Panus rudis PR-1116 ss-1]